MGDNVSVEPLWNDLLSDPNGAKRDVRTKNVRQTLEGYYISEQQMGATAYFGYLNADGAWYIQRAVTTAAVIVYTYKVGTTGYDWSDRATDGGLYKTFDNAF